MGVLKANTRGEISEDHEHCAKYDCRKYFSLTGRKVKKTPLSKNVRVKSPLNVSETPVPTASISRTPSPALIAIDSNTCVLTDELPRSYHPFSPEKEKLSGSSCNESLTVPGHVKEAPRGEKESKTIYDFLYFGLRQRNHECNKKAVPDNRLTRAYTTPEVTASPKSSKSEKRTKSFDNHSARFHPNIRNLFNHHRHHRETSRCRLQNLAKDPEFIYCLKDFQFLYPLGAGAFGEVWLCKHHPSRSKLGVKVIKKSRIVDDLQKNHLLEEKCVLELLSKHHCPFVVEAVGSFQDEKNFYLVMEYVPGGELFAHLSVAPEHRFSEEECRFYIAEVIVALKYMHENEHVMYRDIKPENLMIDERGHLKIVDFGFAKRFVSGEKTFTFCGTPDYVAPEVLSGAGYNESADYWSLGVLAYELLTGYAPFKESVDSGKGDYRDAIAGNVVFPNYVSPVASKFISKLLQPDPSLRIGHSEGIQEIMRDPFFAPVDFETIEKQEVKPPKRKRCKRRMVCFEASHHRGVDRPRNGHHPVKGGKPGHYPKKKRKAKIYTHDEYFKSFNFVLREDEVENLYNAENSAGPSYDNAAATTTTTAAATATIEYSQFCNDDCQCAEEGALSHLPASLNLCGVQESKLTFSMGSMDSMEDGAVQNHQVDDILGAACDLRVVDSDCHFVCHTNHNHRIAFYIDSSEDEYDDVMDN